ncbi:hypothetical protein SAMN05421874_112137 [Nonomuraea maritima]|uniref:Uncharacterized protein n=1 Tax=Nonomuraea maritima TaxID=683260 RepID=A0A1G9FK20_9ACTN|nr:hypothetical protein [Nonomuraea maritima]SDK88729.1 hypothetical protein SAMN05421874_112137 [Nonomuraea maritima]
MYRCLVAAVTMTAAALLLAAAPAIASDRLPSRAAACEGRLFTLMKLPAPLLKSGCGSEEPG